MLLLKNHSGCLDSKKFFPLLTRPQGSMGCQKITFFSQMKVFSFCAKIASKRHKLQKTIKIEETMSKKPCLHRLFQIFYNLRAILAHQTSTGMFSGSWRIFWHPWDPWGWIHIGNIKILAFVFDFLYDRATWRIFSLFSNWSQMSPLLIWHA